ncbi:MAG: rhomboid family intramembrane serine protease [Alphaproteobacteria bacterium CG_4_10_14_0_8_um_filter_53_9]|nr:MAG: rhomboid family intramembrane serine protease [Alphaproteobacteria bacterium CG_4_10_14_0_8_um_filter_53_9]
MIPLSDNSPNHTTPVLTYALIVACVAVFLLQNSGGSAEAFHAFVMTYGFVPARFFGLDMAVPYGMYDAEPAPWLTMFTSMFMHGDIMHIAGNMLYLWVFGDNLENHLGRVKFLAFYLATGVAAALAQGMVDPTSAIPMVGASGAISGILGGYFLLHPKQPISVLIPNAGIVTMPAFVMIGMWFGYQALMGILSDSGGGGVAFFAHIGGFVAGFILMLFLRRRPRPQLWD